MSTDNESLQITAAMIAGGLASSRHGLPEEEVARQAIRIARAIQDQLRAAAAESSEPPAAAEA